MKKLMVLMIAISFCIFSAGNALADEPAISSLDQHAVWSKWFDHAGNRLPENPGVMDSASAKAPTVQTQTTAQSNRTAGLAEFDFIHETKSYDYSKDRGNSA
ncbi:MAG: hypothetical protein ACE5ER_02605 [Nitrospinaceae bacterium]